MCACVCVSKCVCVCVCERERERERKRICARRDTNARHDRENWVEAEKVFFFKKLTLQKLFKFFAVATFELFVYCEILTCSNCLLAATIWISRSWPLFSVWKRKMYVGFEPTTFKVQWSNIYLERCRFISQVHPSFSSLMLKISSLSNFFAIIGSSSLSQLIIEWILDKRLR